MPTLLEFQRRFRAALDPGCADDLADLVRGAGAPGRLAVYRNNVLGALSTALGLNFPATARLVGAEFFAAAAARCIAESPPRSADLHEYGEAFPALLATLPGIAARPYIADVARLEWAVAQALHAPLAPALAVGTLAVVPAEEQAGLRFWPHPSLRFVATGSPARAVWEAVLHPDEGARARALAAIDPAEAGEALAVIRDDETIAILPLTEAGFAFAQALADGHTLADSLAAIPPEEAPDLLGLFFAQGFFVGHDPTAPIVPISPEETSHVRANR